MGEMCASAVNDVVIAGRKCTRGFRMRCKYNEDCKIMFLGKVQTSNRKNKNTWSCTHLDLIRGSAFQLLSTLLVGLSITWDIFYKVSFFLILEDLLF